MFHLILAFTEGCTPFFPLFCHFVERGVTNLCHLQELYRGEVNAEWTLYERLILYIQVDDSAPMLGSYWLLVQDNFPENKGTCFSSFCSPFFTEKAPTIKVFPKHVSI